MSDQHKTFQDFVAARRVRVRGEPASINWDEFDEVQRIIDYGDGCHILADEGEPYLLVIGNQEWQSENLAELEDALYSEWYLHEIADQDFVDEGRRSVEAARK